LKLVTNKYKKIVIKERIINDVENMDGRVGLSKLRFASEKLYADANVKLLIILYI